MKSSVCLVDKVVGCLLRAAYLVMNEDGKDEDGKRSTDGSKRN